MIKDFIILNCIGKDDKIGLRINENFYIHELENYFNFPSSLIFARIFVAEIFCISSDNTISSIL